jgi:hypothetical protein
MPPLTRKQENAEKKKCDRLRREISRLQAQTRPAESEQERLKKWKIGQDDLKEKEEKLANIEVDRAKRKAEATADGGKQNQRLSAGTKVGTCAATAPDASFQVRSDVNNDDTSSVKMDTAGKRVQLQQLLQGAENKLARCSYGSEDYVAAETEIRKWKQEQAVLLDALRSPSDQVSKQDTMENSSTSSRVSSSHSSTLITADVWWTPKKKTRRLPVYSWTPEGHPPLKTGQRFFCKKCWYFYSPQFCNNSVVYKPSGHPFPRPDVAPTYKRMGASAVLWCTKNHEFEPVLLQKPSKALSAPGWEKFPWVLLRTLTSESKLDPCFVDNEGGYVQVMQPQNVSKKGCAAAINTTFNVATDPDRSYSHGKYIYVRVGRKDHLDMLDSMCKTQLLLPLRSQHCTPWESPLLIKYGNCGKTHLMDQCPRAHSIEELHHWEEQARTTPFSGPGGTLGSQKKKGVLILQGVGGQKPSATGNAWIEDDAGQTIEFETDAQRTVLLNEALDIHADTYKYSFLGHFVECMRICDANGEYRRAVSFSAADKGGKLTVVKANVTPRLPQFRNLDVCQHVGRCIHKENCFYAHKMDEVLQAIKLGKKLYPYDEAQKLWSFSERILKERVYKVDGTYIDSGSTRLQRYTKMCNHFLEKGDCHYNSMGGRCDYAHDEETAKRHIERCAEKGTFCPPFEKENALAKLAKDMEWAHDNGVGASVVDQQGQPTNITFDDILPQGQTDDTGTNSAASFDDSLSVGSPQLGRNMDLNSVNEDNHEIPWSEIFTQEASLAGGEDTIAQFEVEEENYPPLKSDRVGTVLCPFLKSGHPCPGSCTYGHNIEEIHAQIFKLVPTKDVFTYMSDLNRDNQERERADAAVKDPRSPIFESLSESIGVELVASGNKFQVEGSYKKVVCPLPPPPSPRARMQHYDPYLVLPDHLIP